ncbi:MAG: cytidylate kinase-like family protein [Pseudoflavonifractor sp.]|nr:cytidylate kinase-like family protein [Alloprevotella sp.]MCM1117376.1 cytidylate kinase-like family protein [Pseudoflavonifractor sp.]
MDSTLLPPPDHRVVVTVGRQFGSGGRVFGRLLADRFGLRYYDKELLSEAARRSGLSREFFEKSDEKVPSFIDGLFSFAAGLNPMSYFQGSTAIGDDSIYRAQSDFIRQLAAEGNCVIVGRSADYVLRNDPRLVSIFVHADDDDCMRRILDRDPEMTPDKVRSRMNRVNRVRAAYYNFYTDKTWGAANSYDLTFNTSRMPMDKLVDLTAEYIRSRFDIPFPIVAPRM